MLRRSSTEYLKDIYIEDSDTVIEVKSLLAFNKEALIPTVYSERAITQLKKIKKLLADGHRACYIIASLYQGVECVHINPDQQEFHTLFEECLEAGMSVAAVALQMTAEHVHVKKLIGVAI